MWKQSQYTFGRLINCQLGQLSMKWVYTGEVVCVHTNFRSCFSTEITHWWLFYISTTNVYD